MIKLATGLRIAALFAAAAGVLFALFAATLTDLQSTAGVLKVAVDDPNAGDLPLALRSVITVGPALTFAYAMWQLAKLLKLAAVGEVFSAPAATYLRSFSVWLLITTVLQVSLGFVVKGLYLWIGAAEHGRLDLTLHSSNLWNVFISALFMLVARVLADAYVIAEDNKQII
jgi:hypothetical protein